MSKRVVRRMGSGQTHVMNVERTYPNIAFGSHYREPEPGRAACGVQITDGVVMKPGTPVRCRSCKHITGIEAQPDIEVHEYTTTTTK